MELKTYFAQDQEGKILPEAYVYLYLTGTTTLASGLVDKDGNSLANPFQTDSDGLIQLAAPDGAYDLRVAKGGLNYAMRVQFLDAREAVDSIAASADRAESEADRAETARDAAQLSAGVYADTTSGLAATAEGNYFSVPSVEDDEYLILYRHDAGPVATLVERYPSAAAVDQVRAYTDDRTAGLDYPEELAAVGDDVPLVTDSEGKVALSMDSTGAMKAYQMLLSLLGVGAADLSGEDDVFSPLLHAVTDANGHIAMAVDRLGHILGHGFSSHDAFDLLPGGDFTIPFALLDADDKLLFGVDAAGQLILSDVPPGAVEPDDPTRRDVAPGELVGIDINHFVVSGQSLSVRSGDFLPVTDDSDLVFSGGFDLDEEETGNTFVPMASDNTGVVMFDALQQLKFLIAGNNNYTADPLYNDDYTILGSSHGYGGASIEGLSEGGSTGSYEDLIWAVQEGARLSGEQGLSYAVQAFNWIQGESDRNDTAAEYKTKFESMLANYRTDIDAITGQPIPFPVFTYQPSGQQFDAPEGSEVPNTIAQAYFELSQENADVLITTPTYWIPHVDDLHPTNEGGKWFGMMWGKALYKALYRKEGWRPLEPRRIDTYGPRIVVARFHVPEPPLVFDTTNVTDPGNYGFDVRDDSGTLTITDVEIVGTDAVRIAVDRDITTNPVVSYAYYGIGGNGGGPETGARGNLRDSDPTIGVDGFDRLWNWAVAFNVSLPYTR